MASTRKKNVRLTPEQRHEVYEMYKNGANQYELAEMFDISQRTVSSIVKSESIAEQGYAYDRTHVGSRIAKTIDSSPKLEQTEKPRATSPIIPNQATASSVVVQRQVTLEGLGTHFRYIVTTGSDELEIIDQHSNPIMSISINELNDLILELQGVANNYKNVVVGIEAW